MQTSQTPSHFHCLRAQSSGLILPDSCAKTEVIAELDMISRRCNPVATSSNFAWYNLAMDDEVDVDDEEADEQPKNKQPRTTAWPCRLQALIYKTAFIFRRVEVRGRH